MKQKEDDGCYQVRWTASGSWTEWSLWGAIGGGIVGGGTVAGSIITGTGGVTAIHPVGWVVIGVGTVGGGIVGALTFKDEKTATLDKAWRICCECDTVTNGCIKRGPEIVHDNVNNSTGDLYWKNDR